MSLNSQQRIFKYAESKENILKAGVQLYQWEKYQGEQLKLQNKLKQAGIAGSEVDND